MIPRSDGPHSFSLFTWTSARCCTGSCVKIKRFPSTHAREPLYLKAITKNAQTHKRTKFVLILLFNTIDFVDNGLHLGISHASTTSALGLHRHSVLILLMGFSVAARQLWMSTVSREMMKQVNPETTIIQGLSAMR